eukprot:5154684-Ditylum_brightwellii.AAC.2
MSGGLTRSASVSQKVVTQNASAKMILCGKTNVFAPFHCGKLVAMAFIFDWKRPLVAFLMRMRWRCRSGVKGM